MFSMECKSGEYFVIISSRSEIKLYNYLGHYGYSAIEYKIGETFYYKGLQDSLKAFEYYYSEYANRENQKLLKVKQYSLPGDVIFYDIVKDLTDLATSGIVFK